jgi:hypothetical protein
MPKPSPEEIVQHFSYIARHWKGLRDREDSRESWPYKQAEHWFRCLAWVTGFERLPGEDINAYIARAAALYPEPAINTV